MDEELEIIRSFELVVGDKPHIRDLAHRLLMFVEADLKVNFALKHVGAVYYSFLELPLERKKRVVEEIADKRGMEPPEWTDDARETGRKQLLEVLYAPYPNLLAVPEGEKDSIAGKRFSDAVQRYKSCVQRSMFRER